MNKLILGAMLLAVLIAFSAPAMGSACDPGAVTTGPCPCACGTSGTVTSGTMTADGGEPGTSSFNNLDVGTIPAGATIKWARLYWHAWMPGSWTNVTFYNATGCTGRDFDISDTTHPDPTGCYQGQDWGFYRGGETHFMYWNVTNLVKSGAHNVSMNNPGGDGRCMQCYLVVVYEKAGYPTTSYWVNQGHMFLGDGGATYTTNFAAPPSADDTTNGTLWQLGLTHNNKVEIWFNTVNLVTTTYGGGCGYGELEEYEIPAGWINAAGGNSMTWKNWDDYYHPVLAMFMDQRPPGKDLIVEEIGFNPATPRPDQNFAVTATVKNQGGLDITNSFNVRLYVNDVLNSTDQPVMSLGAGSSTPVTFPNVNLPEGCYGFKVVADIGDTIDESNEDNNETAVNHQVGYVIVVDENSDFADLETEGLAREDGGTYYIEDLTITNCAGDGITIENVNVPFVIDNCTIHDCTSPPGSAGVFMNNVTGGTITDCTIRNNQEYGIELGVVSLDPTDPKFINITCNTIYENGLNGINLIGYNCTVAYNHVRDNAIYGIYVFGNDSRIHNNTIENNTKYGIKLYNSSGNYIYRNDIIDNNGTGVQGYDGWLGLPGLDLNTWNMSTNVSYCYDNCSYYNYIGNYWNDHDNNNQNDGIANTPYTLDGEAGEIDSHPAAVPLWRCGDVNRNGAVNYLDATAAYNGHMCSSRWAADANCDCVVNYQDATDIQNGNLNCCPVCCTCGECYCGR